jgi:hypothetical protein
MDAEAPAGPAARPRPSLAGRLLGEALAFLGMAAYLWVLFALFVLQRSLVLAQNGLDLPSPYGFAVVHALVFAKVMLVADRLGLGRGLEQRPLVQAILFKSFAFAVLFVAFHAAEEAVLAAWRGHSAAVDAGAVAELLVTGAIFFVELVPFFAMQDLGRVLGRDRLLRLLFARPADAAAAAATVA